MDDLFPKFQERLEELLSKKHIQDPSLLESVHYATHLGGKRLRPKMALAVAGEKALDFACGIECIHTYSLIHDDLPCMDNALTRRGKPSLHIAFGEMLATLTGDLLLTYAFEILSSGPDSSCEIIQMVAKRIGASGMLGGQVLDMHCKQKPFSWETYQTLAKQKTSELFVAALEGAAILLGVKDRTPYIHFGYTFGLMYQILDDLEDDEAPSAVSLLGKEGAIEMLSLLLTHAKHTLSLLEKPCPFLEEALAIFRAPLTKDLTVLTQ